MTDHDDASVSDATPGGLDRRTLLKRSAVAGAVVFATPMITSRPAAATGSAGNDTIEPVCRCWRFKWEAGQGFEASPGAELPKCLPPNKWADPSTMATDGAGSNGAPLVTVVVETLLDENGESTKGEKATVEVTASGCAILGIEAAAGSANAGRGGTTECSSNQSDGREGALGVQTVVVELFDKEISFVAGVVCCGCGAS